MAGPPALDRKIVVRIHAGQSGSTRPPSAPVTIALSAHPDSLMEGSSAQGFRLISGTANAGLAQEISRHLAIELCKVTISRFADGEIFVRIDENIRGQDVF